MKKFLILILFSFFCSCEKYIEKPTNLLSQDKMAEILADMSINDQSSSINPSGNLELGTRFILKKHKIKPENFVSSYRYYIVKNQFSGITENAQEIIKNKHPEAAEYIEKKQKENLQLPPLSR